jgi:hypothetical protein
MAAAERVQALRLVIGSLENLKPKEYLSAPNLSEGIPRGVIVELIGPCKTEWLIQFLKLHPEFRTFWAESEQRILPTALHQRGVNLKQITFATLGTQMTKPLRRVLQSQVFDVIVAPNQFPEIKVLKAFQLFAEKSNSTLFLLGQKEPAKSWPISLQLNINKNEGTEGWESFHMEILKHKHGKFL